MKIHALICILYITLCISYGQTPVDRIIEELEILSNASYNNWKYTTDMTLEEAGFVIPDGSMTDNPERPVYSDDTLIEALKYQGGEDLSGMAQTLLRAATAALLNAAHPEISYPLSVAEVISSVNNALTEDRDTMEDLKDQFDIYNNL